MTLCTSFKDSPLLQSNEPPSDSQIAFCRARLEEKDAQIRRLDAKRKELQREIDEEEAERSLYLCMLSPFRRIPDDILQEIFLACIPEDLISCVPYMGEESMIFTQVCSRWRTLARGTAGLWTKIAIGERFAPLENRPFDNRKTQKIVERRVQEWANLSKEMPLQVYMCLGRAGAQPWSSGPLPEWVNRVIRPLAPRIHHLTLRADKVDDLLQEPLFTEWGVFPEIRSVIIDDLRFVGTFFDSDDEADEAATSVGRCPIFPGAPSYTARTYPSFL